MEKDKQSRQMYEYIRQASEPFDFTLGTLWVIESFRWRTNPFTK
jgi:hypothetical protein